MSKYYVSDNANRRIRVGSINFAFQVTENFAGAWRGVMALTKPEEIEAFDKVASALGAREITQDEYETQLKKKVISPAASVSPSLSSRMTVAGRGAAVVASGAALPSGKPKPVSTVPTVVQTLDEIIPVGVAPYVDPLEQKLAQKPKRGKKNG